MHASQLTATLGMHSQVQRRHVIDATLALEAAQLEHSERERQLEQDFLALTCHEV